MSFVAPRVSDARAFGRVAVLLGGDSSEREISLLTGHAVLNALRERGVDAHGFDPGDTGYHALLKGGFDRVWIALHGRGGEDGTVQGLLDSFGLPYTGSSVLGSALAMDKVRSKILFTALGLATPPWTLLDADSDVQAVIEEVGLPAIVKPAHEGSSVGLKRIDTAAELEPAWRAALDYDSAIIVERWIDGEEYTVGVLDNQPLPLIRIETPREFYDYEAKYLSDTTLYHCPCGLDTARERELANEALIAFDAVGASGWGRVDFLLDRNGVAQMLEVNTIPGMTSHSLVPRAAREAGMDFPELVWRVLETSLAEVRS